MALWQHVAQHWHSTSCWTASRATTACVGETARSLPHQPYSGTTFVPKSLRTYISTFALYVLECAIGRMSKKFQIAIYKCQQKLVQKDGKISMNIAAAHPSGKILAWPLGATEYDSGRKVDYQHKRQGVHVRNNYKLSCMAYTKWLSTIMYGTPRMTINSRVWTDRNYNKLFPMEVRVYVTQSDRTILRSATTSTRQV